MATATRKDYFKVFAKPMGPLEINDQEFRFTAIRRDYGNLRIDRYVESCEWRDQGSEDSINTIPVLRGNITLRKPGPDEPGRVKLHDGHVIKCDVLWGGRWTEAWRMRIQKPSLGYDSGEWAFDLADDLVLCAQSRSSFKYRKGKKRKKKGWRYDEIVKDIARKYRIPLGSITKGKHRITNFNETDISPLEAIRQVTALEMKHEFRKLVIVWRYDKRRRRSGLNIVPLRRNTVLYQFKDLIRTAELTQTPRAKKATALIVRGVQKRKGSKTRRKIRSKVVDKAAVKKYGYIQRDYRVRGTVTSVAALRRKAKLEIRRQLAAKLAIENLTHPGIAFVRRGDAVRITIPEEGYSGKKSILFVTSVVHNLTAGDFAMTLSLGLTDPVEKARVEREKALRAAKRKKKGKRR